MTKPKPQKTALCWVHNFGDPVSVLLLHEHHRRPQAYGGEDDPANLIWLCAGCHDFLHRLATMLYSGKTGLVQDMLNLYLPNSPAARDRLFTLIKEAVAAKVEFTEQMAVTEDEEATILMQLEVPRWVHAKLKTFSQDFKHPSGKNFGLYAYATSVLTQHALTGGFTVTSNLLQEEYEPPNLLKRMPRKF